MNLPSQNYPNPFNPITKINFSIPKATNVKVTVFDAIGRELPILVNEEMNPSNYSVDWNAINMSSAIYLYKIESINFVDVKKIILIK